MILHTKVLKDGPTPEIGATRPTRYAKLGLGQKKGVKCRGLFLPPAGGSQNRLLTRGPECGRYAFWAIAHRKIWIICDILRYGSQKSIIRQKSYRHVSIDFSEIFDDFRHISVIIEKSHY